MYQYIGPQPLIKEGAMFKDLKWETVEQAYKTLLEKNYKEGDFLVLFIKPKNCDIRRRNITVEHFKISMWHLYNSEILFDEIAIVDAGGDNDILFRYDRRHKIDEGMPTTGDENLIKLWKKFNENRKTVLLEILTSQIYEEINAATE